MENVQNILVLLLAGLGAILAVVFTLTMSLTMVSISAKAWRTFVTIDHNPATLAVGQSLIGKYLHDQLAQLVPLVDAPDDAAIQRLAKLPVLKQLYDTGVIDEKSLAIGISKIVGETLGLGIELLNAKKVESNPFPVEDQG